MGGCISHWHKGSSWTRDCASAWSIAHCLSPAVNRFDAENVSPSTVTLSTDSCRLLPLRTTFTVCHSLSFSFCPANSVSGPLPVVGGGERKRNQNHKWHGGIAACTSCACPHSHKHAHTVHAERASERQCWGRKPACARDTFTVSNVPPYRKMETTKYSA